MGNLGEAAANAEQDARPKVRRNDVLERDLGDGLLVYDFRSLRVISLNRPSALIWSLCDGEHTIGEITAALEEGTGRGCRGGRHVVCHQVSSGRVSLQPPWMRAGWRGPR